MREKELFTMQMVRCDFFFSRNGVDYELTAMADSRQLEDPEEKNATRGASGRSKKGIIYTTGIKDPKTMTLVCIGLTKEYADLIAEMYENDERTDFKIVDRKTGRMAKMEDGFFAKRPIQEQMGEGAEELNVSLLIRGFKAEQ